VLTTEPAGLPPPIWLLGPQLRRSDIPGLCEMLAVMIRDGGATVVLCDVSRVRADTVLVETLLRLQLTARRLGGRIRVHRAMADMLELLALVGVSDVLLDD
jgi:ABC-type transporter Mla MlaB component